VVTDELIDFTDLAPTMINLVGGDLPDYLKGRILLGENRSPKAEHLVLSTDRVDNGIDKVRSVTNGKYIYSRVFMPYMPEVRYINYFEIGEITQHMRHDLASGNLNPFQESLFHGRLPESLYDIENDSWETKNLANDPTYKELLNDFREQLKNEIIGSRDVLLLPEYEIGKISENSTPYEFRLDEEAYPISEIYEAASLSGFRGEETAQKQVLLLKYENPFIRYWAIVGLRSQEKVLKEVYKEPIIEALNDSYPPVAVTAAAIAYRSFGNKKAEALLNEFIQQENQDLALMAINYLLYTDNIEPFIESVRNVQNRKTSMYRVTSACADFFMRNKISP
jgi:hypothetical protein